MNPLRRIAACATITGTGTTGTQATVTVPHATTASDQPWWRTYAAALALAVGTMVQAALSWWHWYDQVRVPLNTLFLVAVLSTLFGSGRAFHRRFCIYLWALLTVAAATPAAEYMIRGSIPTPHVVGFVILDTGLATLLLFYQRKFHRLKHHPDPATPVDSSRLPQAGGHRP